MKKIFNPTRLLRMILYVGLLGVAAGLMAVLYQYLLEYVYQFCFNKIIGISPDSPVYRETPGRLMTPGVLRSWSIIFVPAAGGLLVGLISWLAARNYDRKDLDEIESYMHRRGEYPIFKPLINLLLSVITLGTGGSGGKESPAGSMGAGIGSLIGRIFKLDAKTRRILMSAGVAAGIGAIFRIPVAASFFATEFYYSSVDLEADVLLPSALASAVSYAVFAHFFGFSPMLPDTVRLEFVSALDLAPYALLALVSCAGAFLYVKTFQLSASAFSKMKAPEILKPFAGALLTGLLTWTVFILSGDTASLSIMGDGFGTLMNIFSGRIAVIGAFLLLIIALGKTLTTSLTIGSGGIAGLFSPSLVIGGALGGCIGLVMNMLLPGIAPRPEAFVIIGMSAFFSAAFKTPICATLVACELTGDFTLLLPAFVACIISFVFSRGWTIYPTQLPSRPPLPQENDDGFQE